MTGFFSNLLVSYHLLIPAKLNKKGPTNRALLTIDNEDLANIT